MGQRVWRITRECGWHGDRKITLTWGRGWRITRERGWHGDRKISAEEQCAVFPPPLPLW